MHPECPDFDLCAKCEMHPIPMHTPNHPMLKIKTTDTVVPTVHRVTQAPLSFPTHREASPSFSPSPRSYSRGYLHNPSVRSAASPVVFPRSSTTQRPHSPPFRPREASRSRSRSPDFLPKPVSDITFGVSQMMFGRPITPSILAASPTFSPPKSRGRCLSRSRSPYSTMRNYSPIVIDSRTPSPQPQISLSRSPRFRSPSFTPPPVCVTVPAARAFVTAFPEGSALSEFKIEPSFGGSSSSSVSSGSPSTFKLPPLSLEPASDLSREFWPRVTQELRHLMQQDTIPEAAVDKGSSAVSSDLNRPEIPRRRVAIDSSLNEEALLKRPEPSLDGTNMSQICGNPVISVNRSLTALLNGYQPSSNLPSPIATSVANYKENLEEAASSSVESELTASAEFVADITVPVGQVFPPGAEFVKSWRMLNNGKREWPTSTTLVFAAGASLVKEDSGPPSVRIGKVAAGESIDVRTGELKASFSSAMYPLVHH